MEVTRMQATSQQLTEIQSQLREQVDDAESRLQQVCVCGTG